MVETAKVIPLKQRALHFGRLQEVGHARREMSAIIPAETPLEAILEPTYWKHYIRELVASDVVEAFCEDGSWEASLRVMFVSTTEARMAVRWKVSYEEIEVPTESNTHEVVWKGPHWKWTVIRKDDGEVLEKNFGQKSEASHYLNKHTAQLKT